MEESLPTSHSDLMNLRAKGKKLHRRTQSHTTFTLNEVVNRKNNSEDFFQEMLQTNNVLTGDITQKVLDAVNREANEKEVIIDDIDEIPNTGLIVPQRMSNSLNNPLNNNLQRRAQMMRNNFQINNSQFKKLDMLAQVRNIDDITGLGTIHEKRNSMESIDTENMNKRSPNMTNSGSSSQNVSKPVSRTHSKHPSLDFRVGHSNSSSMDFRPMHSKQSSGDMWSLHSKQPSADFKPTHTKQSSADFRSLSKEAFGRVEKEIDIVKYNLLSPKTVKVSDTIQMATNIDYIDKRNRFITELQKSSVEKTIKRGNTVPEQLPSSKQSKTEEAKPKQKLEKPKLTKAQTSSKHRRTYSGNIGKGGEITIPQEDLTSSAGFSAFKNPREYTTYDTMPTPSNKPHHDFNLEVAELKKERSDDSMKKLIISIIESFAQEKSQLEEKIHMQEKQIQIQDKQIKELMGLVTRYQEDMKLLRARNEVKTSPDSDKKPTANKEGGLNILTSTDGSAFDSSLTESSGFLSNKDGRIKSKPSMTTSTPQGQLRPHTAKGNERKSPSLLGPTTTGKTELTKKISLGAKKPVTKKV